MKISSLQSNYSLYNRKQKCTANLSFQGRTINGNYYTDRVYADALNYKNLGYVDCTTFCERYGFWDYFFTDKSENHAAAVNNCIDDIKAVEKRESDLRAERLRKQEEEKRRIENELLALKQKEVARQNLIDSYIKIKKDEGLGCCDLSDETKDELVNEFITPFAESIADSNEFVNVPNAVLVAGKNPFKNEEVIKGLAKQILKCITPDNFVKIQYEGNSENFQTVLSKTKENAKTRYLKNKDITVIYIPNFDKVAVRNNNEAYMPEINSFLKVFILDCAKNGVFVFASAEKEKDIESPFLINSRRFGVSINLDDEV